MQCSLHGRVVADIMSSRRSKSKAGFSVEHHGRQIHVIKVDDASTKDWEKWILLRSDAHHDSKHCRRDIELRHLQEAVDRNAIVLDLGDCLDLMQGRGDNRASKSSLRSGLLASNYFDRVIREAAEFYTQKHNGVHLSRQFALIGQGNHESAWLKFHETCPTDNLVRAIRTCDPDSPVGAGAYGGYVHLQFSFNGNTKRAFTIRYMHGASSGGIMSMGALDAKRAASWIVDANLIAIGHTHDSMVVPLPRERFRVHNGKYRIENEDVGFVRVGTYKDEFYQTEGMGWAVERGGGPKPLRAKWLRLYPVWEYARGQSKSTHRGIFRLGWDVIDAT